MGLSCLLVAFRSKRTVYSDKSAKMVGKFGHPLFRYKDLLLTTSEQSVQIVTPGFQIKRGNRDKLWIFTLFFDKIISCDPLLEPCYWKAFHVWSQQMFSFYRNKKKVIFEVSPLSLSRALDHYTQADQDSDFHIEDIFCWRGLRLFWLIHFCLW